MRTFFLTACAVFAVGVFVQTYKVETADASYIILPVAGGQQSEKIAVAGTWTASSDQAWCVIPASGSGKSVEISATANTDKLPRKAFVTIKSEGGEKTIAVAQEPKLTPNLSQSWSDADGTRRASIPANKKFWNTGEVLEYNRATVGKGVNIVIFNDAFNRTRC